MKFAILGGAFGFFLGTLGHSYTGWQFYAMFAFLVAAYLIGATEK